MGRDHRRRSTGTKIRPRGYQPVSVTIIWDDLDVVPGTANFLLCHLPGDGPTAAELVARCQPDGLFVRDVSTMGATLGSHAVRMAVKDRATNARMLDILAYHLRREPALPTAAPAHALQRRG